MDTGLGMRKRKKRSFVQSIKKKFKNNYYRGSGTRLDDDVHEYFLRVFQHSKQEFASKDERRVFIENVFSQTEGHEIEYSCNQLVSRIIESLLPECSESVFLRYLDIFSADMRPICCHQFASHVLEALLRISSKFVFEYERNDDEKTNEEVERYTAFVLKVSRFLLNNLDEFIFDTYANQVTRTAISCLSGVIKDRRSMEKNVAKLSTRNITPSNQQIIIKYYPDEFKALLKEFIEWVLNSHLFSEYAKHVLLSGLVQSLLISINVTNRVTCKELITKLLHEIYSPDEKSFDIMNLLKNQEAAHLLSTMVSTSTDSELNDIWLRCFVSKLSEMALSKTANYTVQKLIDRCINPEMLDAIYNELSGCFKEIMKVGYTGVLFSLSKACHRIQTKEQEFVKDLMIALENDFKNVNGSFIFSLLSLTPDFKIDENFKDMFKINLHGSLITQELLKFSNPDKVIKSILAMDNSQLIHVLCDQKGSRISDVILGNEMKKEKYKTKFINKLMGSYLTLAIHNYGSFTVTSLWKVADIEQKIKIVEELVDKESLLMNTFHGKIVARTVCLETYKHQPSDWKRAQKQFINTKELFSDVIQ